MGVDIGLYTARIGLFGTRHCKLFTNSLDIHAVRSAYTWFIELTIVVLLRAGGAGLNAEPQMQQMMRVGNGVHGGTKRRKGYTQVVKK